MSGTIFSYRPFKYGDLKEATASLIEASGGERRAADSCRVGKSMLSDYANTYREDVYMPVDVVMQLEKAAGTRCITEHLAFGHGCVLVQMPKVSGDPVQIIKQLGEAQKEHGDLISVLGADIADNGRVDDPEKALKEADEAMKTVALVRQSLVAMIEVRRAAA